jgi:hypothetical protein
LVILLLALLALVAGSGSEPPAPRAASTSDRIANAKVRSTPGERHETDDGLSSQPSLSRPGVMTGKARPPMTGPAQPQRSPWQGAAPVALNLPKLKGPRAINTRIPSGVWFARASARAT